MKHNKTLIARQLIRRCFFKNLKICQLSSFSFPCTFSPHIFNATWTSQSMTEQTNRAACQPQCSKAIQTTRKPHSSCNFISQDGTSVLTVFYCAVQRHTLSTLSFGTNLHAGALLDGSFTGKLPVGIPCLFLPTVTCWCSHLGLVPTPCARLVTDMLHDMFVIEI